MGYFSSQKPVFPQQICVGQKPQQMQAAKTMNSCSELTSNNEQYVRQWTHPFLHQIF